jgi:hypothetical protein
MGENNSLRSASRAFPTPEETGAAVLPSKGEWSYRVPLLLKNPPPNYFEIESSDYTDSGFSIMGYIHEDDARTMAAAPDLLEACRRTLEMLETIEAKTLVGDEGCLWGAELVRAALAKAGA